MGGLRCGRSVVMVGVRVVVVRCSLRRRYGCEERESRHGCVASDGSDLGRGCRGSWSRYRCCLKRERVHVSSCSQQESRALDLHGVRL